MRRLGDILPGAHFTVSGLSTSGTSRMQLLAWRGGSPVVRILARGYCGHARYVVRTLSADSAVVVLY